MLKWLYHNRAGRVVLSYLTKPAISKFVGKILDSKISIFFIPLFIATNKIDLSEVLKTRWMSFNDFFIRQLKMGARPVSGEKGDLISPCDGLLTVHKIRKGTVLEVKGSRYSVADLLKSKKAARYYKDGYALVFRLTPAHYHRYAYPETGIKSRTKRIDGVLHTVQPIATEATDVYVQNSREWSVINTEDFGPIAFMQVGALLVGRIENLDKESCKVWRGQEAGYFEFGGSTVIMLVKKDKLRVNFDIKKASAMKREFPVRLGETIGRKK